MELLFLPFIFLHLCIEIIIFMYLFHSLCYGPHITREPLNIRIKIIDKTSQMSADKCVQRYSQYIAFYSTWEKPVDLWSY